MKSSSIYSEKNTVLPAARSKPGAGRTDYDVAIAGGGLAGLALSIQLAQQGHRVIVLEKEQYPFHKVCGEYISMESWDFFSALGLDVQKLHPSLISKLELSSASGKILKQELPLGGFGVSRYLLDFALVEIARSNGVIVEENIKVNDIAFDTTHFSFDTSRGYYSARVACGCYGKRSNLDIKWKRPFALAKKNKLNNYVAVKYHVSLDFPGDTIALHNFQGGYCGIVRIEAGKCNLCYLTTAANLKRSGGSISKMEQTILSQNPFLKKILGEAEMLYPEPLTISQISFDKKAQVVDHVLMIGDAAGMITPLCGNGMSMALHGSKLASEQIHHFLQGTIGRKEMEMQYCRNWAGQFSKRMKSGRWIQRLFGNKWLSDVVIQLVKPFPRLVTWLIKQTHGKPF